MRALIASLLILLVSGGIGHASAAVAPSSVAPPTQVLTFHPAGTTGTPVKGTCWTESDIARADAWRCTVGNGIYDPCFSTAAHATWVICDAYPTHPVGVRVLLAAPLPTHSAAESAPPWFIVLGEGTYCAAFYGAAGYYHGLRLDYYCLHPWDVTQHWDVLGLPFARGAVWYATLLASNARSQPLGVFTISVKAIYH